MKGPVAPIRPRHAPQGYVLLLEAIDMAGMSLDPTWSGEEVLAAAMPERTPEDLDHEASEILLREITNNSSLARSEDEIRASLQEQYDLERAPRRRRQAIADWFGQRLIDERISSIALSQIGEPVEIRGQFWTGPRFDEVFDAGLAPVLSDKISFAPGGEQALVMIRVRDLEDELSGKRRTVPKATAESECKRWLCGLMRNGGSRKPKESCWNEARELFPGLGRNQFLRAWIAAIDETGNTSWSRPGPRPTHPGHP
jgi:hypothetical protein